MANNTSVNATMTKMCSDRTDGAYTLLLKVAIPIFTGAIQLQSKHTS